MFKRYVISKNGEYYKNNIDAVDYENTDELFIVDIEKATLYKTIHNALNQLVFLQYLIKVDGLHIDEVNDGKIRRLSIDEYINDEVKYKDIFIYLETKTVLSLCAAMEKEFTKHNLQNEFNEFVDKVESKNLPFNYAVKMARKLITVCY